MPVTATDATSGSLLFYSIHALALSLFPSLITMTYLHSLATVDRLKDLNIRCYHPRRHRSSQGVKGKKQNVHLFIVASFNVQ